MGCGKPNCGGNAKATPIKVGTPQPRPHVARQVGKAIPAKLVKIQWGNR